MGLVAVVVIATLALVSPQAAATSQISGSAEYNKLKLVRDSGGFVRTFTKVNTGDAPFTLTNGVGVGGNDGVWLRLTKASGSGSLTALPFLSSVFACRCRSPGRQQVLVLRSAWPAAQWVR